MSYQMKHTLSRTMAVVAGRRGAATLFALFSIAALCTVAHSSHTPVASVHSFYSVQPECGAPGAGTQCVCPRGTVGPLGGGDGAGGPCAPAAAACGGRGKTLQNRTWTSVFNGVCGALTAPVVENYAVPCYSACGSQQGPCSFCGAGYCCRLGFADTSNGCDGSVGIQGIEGHACSLPPTQKNSVSPCDVYAHVKRCCHRPQANPQRL